jgi:hypothetical protein
MLTGQLKSILKFRFIHTRKFTIEFIAANHGEEQQQHKGFVISFASNGKKYEYSLESMT